VVDTLLGVILLFFVLRNTLYVYNVANMLGSSLHITGLIDRIEWLVGFPAGVKLNGDLSGFLGNFILMLIDVWNHVTSALTRSKLILAIISGSTGVLGLSVVLAAANDLLFICSFGMLFLYTVFAGIYRSMLEMLGTQLKLFRGRKFNTIRGRDDSNVFQVHELYLGVLIVTLSLFLLPTVAFYYFYGFIGTILSVLALQLTLILVQVLVNSFPYFLLVWSLCYPYSFPNRIKFDFIANEVCIIAQPLNFGSIFTRIGREFAKLGQAGKSKLLHEIFSSVLYGRSLFYIMRDFSTILAFQDERTQEKVSLSAFLK